MIIEKATKGQDYLKSLVKKYPSSQVLKLCATQYYDNLITGCRFGIPHFATDPRGVNWDVSGLYEGPFYCGRRLAEEKIVHEPSVSKLNDEMR